MKKVTRYLEFPASGRGCREGEMNKRGWWERGKMDWGRERIEEE